MISLKILEDRKMERTLLIVKPNARAYYQEIAKFIERHSLTVSRIMLGSYPQHIWERHYEEHRNKPYYIPLCETMANRPIAIMLITGENAVVRVRELAGKTNPEEAAEGTLRKKYGQTVRENGVHASDSKESAEREIHLWFLGV